MIEHKELLDQIREERKSRESILIKYPILILSDLHLKHPAGYISQAEQLFPMIKEAGTVIFNGDTTELKWKTNGLQGPSQLEQLVAVCRENEANPIFLNGNHDPDISLLNFMEIANGEVFVTHGDILFHGLSPWAPESRRAKRLQAHYLHQCEAPLLSNFEVQLQIARLVARAVKMPFLHLKQGSLARIWALIRECWPPYRPFSILRFWRQTPQRADDWAKKFRPDCRFFLIGHTHFPGIWQRNSRVIINTGSYMPFSGRRAVLIEESKLEVRQVVFHKSKFFYGPLIEHYPLEREKYPVQNLSANAEIQTYSDISG